MILLSAYVLLTSLLFSVSFLMIPGPYRGGNIDNSASKDQQIT